MIEEDMIISMRISREISKRTKQGGEPIIKQKGKNTYDIISGGKSQHTGESA